jgi:hypothetical protein
MSPFYPHRDCLVNVDSPELPASLNWDNLNLLLLSKQHLLPEVRVGCEMCLLVSSVGCEMCLVVTLCQLSESSDVATPAFCRSLGPVLRVRAPRSDASLPIILGCAFVRGVRARGEMLMWRFLVVVCCCVTLTSRYLYHIVRGNARRLHYIDRLCIWRS